MIRIIAKYINDNSEVREIFPALRPDPEGPWTNTQLKILRVGDARDPSVRGVGVHGALTGGRVDYLIVDDILDPENVATDAARKKLEDWYRAVVVGCLTSRSRILVVGTAFHPKDLLHTLSRQPGFRWFRFPVVREDGTLSWPEQYPLKRVEEKRAEMGPSEFARQMLCRARSDDESRFKQEWIDLALRAGEGMTMIHSLDELPEGCMTFTGVDLAAAQNKKSDECSFFTFIEDSKGNRRILDITAGKFTGPVIIDILKDIHRRYHSILVVESNGSQAFIQQFASAETNLPIIPFQTGSAKWDPQLGVEGMAIELANGKWIFPNVKGVCDPQLTKFMTELLYYTPKSHTGDRVMSCYFARHQARRMMGGREYSGGVAGVRILGSSPELPPQEQAAIEEGKWQEEKRNWEAKAVSDGFAVEDT